MRGQIFDMVRVQFRANNICAKEEGREGGSEREYRMDDRGLRMNIRETPGDAAVSSITGYNSGRGGRNPTNTRPVKIAFFFFPLLFLPRGPFLA